MSEHTLQRTLTHASRMYAVATVRSVVKHQPISNRLLQAFNAVHQQSKLTSQRWLICISLSENRLTRCPRVL